MRANPKTARFALQRTRGYVPPVALRTQWRGQRDTQSRRFGLLVLASLIAHLPFTPLAAVFGLISLASLQSPTEIDLGELTAIPVALLTDIPGNAVTSADNEADRPKATETDVSLPPDPPPSVEQNSDSERAGPDAAVDAGVAPSDGGPDGGAPDGGAPDGGAPDGGAPSDGGPDGGAPDGGAPDGGARGEPLALEQVGGQVVDSNANVRLQLHNARIRRHPLGPQLGQLLGRIYQWRDFLGPTGLDAIRDFDLTMVAGPQLRDSSKVAAIMLYNVADSKVHGAIDTLVRRGRGGKWLDAGRLAAVARADRAERTFIQLPENKVVMVVPPSAAAHALSLRSLRIPTPTGDWVLDSYVVSPWRVFLGSRFDFPKSIKWMSARVFALEDGGVSAELVLQDESEGAAAENSARIARAINALTQLDLGLVGALLGAKTHRFIEPVQLSPEGDQIRGTVRATQAQLANLLEMAGGFLTPEGRREIAGESRPIESEKRAAPASSGRGTGDIPAPSVSLRPPAPTPAGSLSAAPATSGAASVEVQ